MNDELTEQIFEAKSKDGWRNRVLSAEKPNPNSFFKKLIEEENLDDAMFQVKNGLFEVSLLKEPINKLLKLNNMKTKEMKVVAPEGYEIDKENSTFECIKFKPIDKKLTYEDVAKELFEDKDIFYINAVGCIGQGKVEEEYVLDPNNCTSKKQAEKLIAINKLMNVAKYLNEKVGEIPQDDKFYYFVFKYGNIQIDWTTPSVINDGCVYFYSRELAQLAADILGEDTIRTALSTDW